MDWKVKYRIALIPWRISLASELRNSGERKQSKMIWAISQPDVCRINRTATAKPQTFMFLMRLSHRSNLFISFGERTGNFNFKPQQSLSSHLLPMRLFLSIQLELPTLKWALQETSLYISIFQSPHCFLLTAKILDRQKYPKLLKWNILYPKRMFCEEKIESQD